MKLTQEQVNNIAFYTGQIEGLTSRMEREYLEYLKTVREIEDHSKSIRKILKIESLTEMADRSKNINGDAFKESDF